MNNQTKFFRLLKAVALLIVISLFTTVAFEGIHAGHQDFCQEDDCAICLVLHIIHNTKKLITGAPLALVEFTAFYYINILALSALLLAPATLVKQKVKLVI